MAKQKFMKGSESWNFFCDFYNLVQEYAVIDNDTNSENDSYWEALIADIDTLYEKYSKPFFKALLLAFLNSKEEEQRQMNGQLQPAG